MSALASLRPKLSQGEDGKPVLELDFGPRGVSAKSLAEVLDLPGTTTLGSAATKLLNAGLIERGDSCWLIADPIHARYLRETGVRIL